MPYPMLLLMVRYAITLERDKKENIKDVYVCVRERDSDIQSGSLYVPIDFSCSSSKVFSHGKQFAKEFLFIFPSLVFLAI